jgi:hypothetical protein
VAILSHAIADDFAAAESDFVAVDRKVFFDLDDEGSVRESDSITDGGPVKVGISPAVNE